MRNSSEETRKKVSSLIDAGDLNEALKIIHDLVENIVTESLCVSQALGSRVLDNLCQRIGVQNYSNSLQKVGSNLTAPGNIYVYLATKMQESGGHSRVIEEYIKARPNDRHIILLTGVAGRSNTNYLTEAVSGIKITCQEAPKGNYLKKLTWIQTRLIEVKPKKVYLFNHHQDSVAVAAIVPNMGLDAIFYHHGDHHLCLGVFLTHLKHIDIHPTGYYQCRDELGIDNSYLPLAVTDNGVRSSDMPFYKDGKAITCTVGRANKVEVPYFISYVELVPNILKVTGGSHVHIGRLSPWALLKIRRGMKHLGIPTEKFIYIPWVQSVWQTLIEYKVDLYIASFPYGGGLTLIEAMGAGVPIVLHRHIYSRVLSGIDIAYPEAFSWRLPEELLNYCESLTSMDLTRQSKLARKHYEGCHSMNIFREALIRENMQEPQRPENDFLIDRAEWVVMLESQISFGRLLSRLIYRILRRLRTHWSF